MLNIFLVMGLHALAMLTFVLGVIFFVFWAIKNLKAEKLFRLSLILIVVGVLVCLFTVALGGKSSFKSHRGYGYGYDMMTKGGTMTWETCQKKVKSLTEAKASTTTDAKKTTTK